MDQTLARDRYSTALALKTMATCGVCTQRCLEEQVTKLPRHVVGGGLLQTV